MSLSREKGGQVKSPQIEPPVLQNPQHVNPITSSRDPKGKAKSSLPLATPQELYNRLKRRIITTNDPTYFELENVVPEAGYQVARSLCEDGEVERRNVTITYNPMVRILSIKMPTAVHSIAHCWVVAEKVNAIISGFFTPAELNDLDLHPNTRFDNFPPPWNNIYKEPDAGIVFAGAALPSVIVESGFTKSWPKLLNDKTLWLRGGAPYVNAVLLVKWCQRDNSRVAGYLEIHRRGGGISPRFQIFPAPPPGTPAKTITWYRQDFYPGGVVPAGRNGNDVWLWHLDNLRVKAARCLAMEDLAPA